MGIVFGPVPSRRLGRSLGINNIPPKICSYACIYCQLGNTIKLQQRREAFYTPKEIFSSVQESLKKIHTGNISVDYLAFVPDGEPSLDINIGRTIDLLRGLGIRIAVITNASLMSDSEVRNDLSKADWVSVKADTVDEDIWRKINRPHGRLQLTEMIEGMLRFREVFNGTLVSETMIINGINDGEEQYSETVQFLAQLRPDIAYISVPTRPPAEGWVKVPPVEKLNAAYQVFRSKLEKVELLTGYEGKDFAHTGDIEENLLSIMSVHPMRKDALEDFLLRSGGSWKIVEKMISMGELKQTEYEGNLFYIRNLEGVTDQMPGDKGN
ncbi:MAG: radical SAM protein [Spirochaetales bacterium]|nr:radical SAM protein [Spirochaetales bacterium]